MLFEIDVHTMNTNHTWFTASVGHAYKASAYKPAEAI